MIRCIIFDFDGTLADTEQFSLNIYNELAEKYNFNKFTKQQYEEAKKLPFSKGLALTGVPASQIVPLLNKGQKLLKAQINNVEPFTDKLKEIIESLKQQVEYVGIISSNTKKNIKRFLKNMDIEVDFIKSSPLFTKEIKITNIMHKLKLQQKDILYVGDETRDIISSNKAGVYSAGVTWGYNSAEMLEKENPTYLINQLSEIFDIIKK